MLINWAYSKLTESMNKIYSNHRSEIADALEVIPVYLHKYIQCDLFEGKSPLNIIHGFEDPDDGRSYSDTAHVVFEGHTNDKRRTMVLPIFVERWVMVHEFGHVIHDSLFKLNNFDLIPCTNYAKTNYVEIFPEAFCSWIFPWYGRKIKENIDFFNSLKNHY